jgi:hypothetical protein
LRNPSDHDNLPPLKKQKKRQEAWLKIQQRQQEKEEGESKTVCVFVLFSLCFVFLFQPAAGSVS